MFIYILSIVVITASLIVLPSNQILPTILAQEDSLTQNTTRNTIENTTGNTTEISEDELQQSGTISRKSK
jgi:hypothetical protein